MSTPRIGLVWAQARDGVIGLDGVMPWHVPEDLAHFKRITLGRPVIMGRRTWDSLPARFRPLEGRRNIVITRQESWSSPGAEVCSSIEDALAVALAGRSMREGDPPEGESPAVDAWVIGGGEIYRQAMDRASVLEVTEINHDFDGDTYAPEIGIGWVPEPAPGPWLTSTRGIEYRFVTYRRA